MTVGSGVRAGMMSIVLWVLAMGAMPQAAAQSFPTKPVRIVVAFPAGGGTDIVARVLGQKLSEYWGQQVLVDNRAGASGTIGTEFAAKAPADGYTMFMGTMGNLTVNKHLFPKMAVDPAKDFARGEVYEQKYFLRLPTSMIFWSTAFSLVLYGIQLTHPHYLNLWPGMVYAVLMAVTGWNLWRKGITSLYVHNILGVFKHSPVYRFFRSHH